MEINIKISLNPFLKIEESFRGFIKISVICSVSLKSNSIISVSDVPKRYKKITPTFPPHLLPVCLKKGTERMEVKNEKSP
jgi:hypothetical protein